MGPSAVFFLFIFQLIVFATHLFELADEDMFHLRDEFAKFVAQEAPSESPIMIHKSSYVFDKFISSRDF